MVTHGHGLADIAAIDLIRESERVRFLCLSQSIADQLSSIGVPQRRLSVVGWGVDTAYFQPTHRRVQAPYLLAAGTARRDYATLVRASLTTTLPVVIAGGSAWKDQPMDIAALPLPRSVTLSTPRSFTALRALYASCAAVVVPLYPTNHAAGFAVIAEAMAMGKPVIVSRTLGHSDMVVDGVTGLYVPPSDAVALADAIRSIELKSSVLERMGMAARRQAERRHSLEAFSRALCREACFWGAEE
jgi:glycosyltransferase involved in cell wall biosynthesis